MAHLDMIEPISKVDFRDGFLACIDEAADRGQIRPFQRIVYRFRLQNRRVLDRVYDQAIAMAEEDGVEKDEAGGFDLMKFFDWLIVNLPKILAILVSFGIL
jgi:hypothetical protein